MAVNANSSHWDRCWSSLWVCAFLIQRMASKKFESRSLRENMRTVRAPFFAILDNFRKEFSPTEKDQCHLTILHDFHCERVGGDKTFGRKVDEWPTFCAKVQTARWVVRRLCQANVFPIKSDDELSEAVVMMAPCLSKFSRDGQFRDKTCNHWLSDEIIQEVDKMRDFDDCEKLFCRKKKNLMMKGSLPCPEGHPKKKPHQKGKLV